MTTHIHLAHNGPMTVVETNFEYPPIPIRSFDWAAVTSEYDGEGCPIGRGETEEEAIADLLAQIEERQ